MTDKASELAAMVRSKLGAALVRLRWDKTTAEQRSEHARQLVAVRWERYRAAQAAAGGNRPRKRRTRKPK